MDGSSAAGPPENRTADKDPAELVVNALRGATELPSAPSPPDLRDRELSPTLEA